MDKATQVQVKAALVTFLRQAETYSHRDVVAVYLPKNTTEDRQLNLLHWEAREIVRVEDGIDFGPVQGKSRTYERKAWNQIAKRGERQRAKGTRAHRRAGERLRLAAETAPDTHKEKLNDAADRIAVRAALRASKRQDV